MFPQPTNPHAAPLGIDGETAIVADYMRARFGLIQTDDPLVSKTFVQHANHWSLDFAIEVDRALDVIARAFNHQGE
jgi:hypothetical protein